MRKNKMISGILMLTLMTSLAGCSDKKNEKETESVTETVAESTTTAEFVTELEGDATEPENDTAEAESETKAAVSGEVVKRTDLEWGKEYKYDLDGNGSEESVKVTHEEEDGDFYVSIIIDKNELSMMFFQDNMTVSVVDLNVNDNEKEIVVADNGLSYDAATYIYRYKDNELEELNIKPGAYVGFEGANVVTFATRTDYYFGTGYNVQEVYTYEDGEFTKAIDYALYCPEYPVYENYKNNNADKKFGDTFTDASKGAAEVVAELEKNLEKDNRTFFAANELELFDYDIAGDKFTSKGKIDKYTPLTVLKISGEFSEYNYMENFKAAQIRTVDGTEGWIKLPKALRFDDATCLVEKEMKDLKKNSDYTKYYSQDVGEVMSNGILLPIMLAD